MVAEADLFLQSGNSQVLQACCQPEDILNAGTSEKPGNSIPGFGALTDKFFFFIFFIRLDSIALQIVSVGLIHGFINQFVPAVVEECAG